jgi:hypothetical protein
MHELPHADRGRIAVAADADGNQLLVCEHDAGCESRHAPVNTIKSVRTARKYAGVLLEQPMPLSFAT